MGVYRNLLILAVLVTGVAWYLQTPVPRGFSDPGKLRWEMGISKLKQDLIWLLDLLKIAPMHITLRSFASPKNITIPDHIYIHEVIVDDVKVRLYGSMKKPRHSLGHPGFVFYHGGGFVIGSPEKYDAAMVEIASAMNIIIMSVNYRKAPEVTFPIPFEDSLKAAKYFLTNSEDFGVNPQNIVIGGDSAGGNLAAAVALKLRDDNFSPMPKIQVLIYPCLQAHDFSLPSLAQNSHGPFLTKYLMAYFYSVYITGTTKLINKFMTNEHTTPEVKKEVYGSYLHHEDLEMDYHYDPYKKPALDYGNAATWNEIKDVVSNPYFAPLMADDVSGLPAAYVYTAHYDVLRDDGLLYVKRLREAGVSVTHVHGTQAFHGVFTRFNNYSEGKECMDNIIKYLIEHL